MDSRANLEKSRSLPLEIVSICYFNMLADKHIEHK